jgi:hypothetical protein
LAHPDILVSMASTKPSPEVGLSPGMPDRAPEPASGSDSTVKAQHDSLSRAGSALSGAPAMLAPKHHAEFRARGDPQHLTSPRPDAADSTSTGSEGRAAPAAPMVTDRIDADEVIGSEPPLRTETPVDGRLDRSRAGDDLLSRTQQISSISHHEAEQPQARKDDALMRSPQAVLPDRTASVGDEIREEHAPDAPRSDWPQANFARSGVLESQTARAPAPSPPARAALDAEQLVARGYSLFDIGDPASARLFFERAATQGHAGAMLATGETFDPLELQRRRIVGVRGEPDRALDWYRRSAAAGDQVAGERLARLNDWISRRANQR